MINHQIASLEKRITQTVMQQYTWIEKTKSVNMQREEEVYQRLLGADIQEGGHGSYLDLYF